MRVTAALTLLAPLTSAWVVTMYTDSNCEVVAQTLSGNDERRCFPLPEWSPAIRSITAQTGENEFVTAYKGGDSSCSGQMVNLGHCESGTDWKGFDVEFLYARSAD